MKVQNYCSWTTFLWLILVNKLRWRTSCLHTQWQFLVHMSEYRYSEDPVRFQVSPCGICGEQCHWDGFIPITASLLCVTRINSFICPDATVSGQPSISLYIHDLIQRLWANEQISVSHSARTCCEMRTFLITFLFDAQTAGWTDHSLCPTFVCGCHACPWILVWRLTVEFGSYEEERKV